jgi:proteasome assembly chaperone (PAC2) family protein
MADPTALQRFSDDRRLSRGVLIAAFAGWNDAGEAATGAVDALAHLFDAASAAQIDPEDFFDFQVNRPTTRLDPGTGRTLEWPTNRFRLAEVNGRGVVLLSGTEPNLRWRTFSNTVLAYATALDVRTIVCIGALQVDTPHTRPVPLTGRGSGLDGVLGLRLRPSDYEGPTGITGVLTHIALERGFETASIWAGVPHYLAGTTYATAAHALAAVVTRALDLDIDLEPLAEAAREQQREIAEVVAQDDDLSSYVAELEERVDAEDDGPSDGFAEHAQHVTGDDLAAAFERYLEERERPGGEA